MKVPCEVYSRVSGYFRPVGQWNNGKREEFAERKFISRECVNGVCDNSSGDSIEHSSVC